MMAAQDEKQLNNALSEVQSRNEQNAEIRTNCVESTHQREMPDETAVVGIPGSAPHAEATVTVDAGEVCRRKYVQDHLTKSPEQQAMNEKYSALALGFEHLGDRSDSNIRDVKNEMKKEATRAVSATTEKASSSVPQTKDALPTERYQITMDKMEAHTVRDYDTYRDISTSSDSHRSTMDSMSSVIKQERIDQAIHLTTPPQDHTSIPQATTSSSNSLVNDSTNTCNTQPFTNVDNVYQNINHVSERHPSSSCATANASSEEMDKTCDFSSKHSLISEEETHSSSRQDSSHAENSSNSGLSQEGEGNNLPSSSHTMGENTHANLDSSHSSDTAVHLSINPINNVTKILTKYVFINKPLKHKSSKKSFGLLYRQAFKHVYKGKVISKGPRKKKKKDKNSKDPPIKKKTTANEKASSSKAKLKNKSKTKTTEPVEFERATRSKAKRGEVQKVANRHSQRKEPTVRISTESKKKKGRRKVLTLKDKVAIIEAMENPTSTLASVVREFDVSRTNVWRILKNKEDILAQAESKEEAKAKKKKVKKTKKVRQEKESVEVKQEIDDEAMMNDGTEASSDNMFYSDLFACPDRKSTLRNRRDLTLEEKVQVIKCLEAPGSRIRAVARMFGVSSSAISRINKRKEFILLRSGSGDSCANEKRSRDCKDPELDKALLRWYRAIEQMQPENAPITISNVLLKNKVNDLVITMGKNYFPSDNWIVRWKHRHNIGSKAKSDSTIVIQGKEELQQFDEKVDIEEILRQLGKEAQHIDQVKREAILKRQEKPEEFMICPHCGVLTSTKKKKQNNHLAGCPSSSSRKDLTLEEKYQVVRALEQPGTKMVTLAKKYGVSTSAISRINKNRIDILSRRASGLANGTRRRDRGSKEPEVERILCEWFKVQNELGIHISGSMIRDKAREIAKVMGKDFWPSESWVFRWRHRNNVTEMNPLLYGESEDEQDGGLERTNDSAEDVAVPNSSEEIAETKMELDGDNVTSTSGSLDVTKTRGRKKKKTTEEDEEVPSEKKFRLPRSVMCEKCGFVSVRVKNKRIKSLRHAKGCPDQKPRNELTYENRAKILKALEEPGATLSSVAREFGISVSSMSRMNQQKERILTHGLDHGGQKRIRDCKEPEVAHSLYKWYMEKKAEGIHVTGPKLKERAKKLAAEMGREFNASSGWLGRWRHRYNIVGSANRANRIPKAPSLKRKRNKKPMDAKSESPSEHLTQLQPIPTELHQDSMGSQASVIIEPLEPVPPPPPQPTTVFLHQRFQNPWELAQQQTNSCLWTKEFLGAPGPSTQEEAMAPVSYAYNDAVPKPMFHNMFDSFSGVGYQVAMPVDSSMVGRDYLKTDAGDDGSGPSSHMTHKPHPSHQQLPPPHHQRPNLNHQSHLQHHPPVPHQHSHSAAPHHHQASLQQQQPQPSQQPHPLPAPSPAAGDEDPEQQRQVMEAFKIMSSFAAKKALGGQVQAALRTIEMSMKTASKKTANRHTYTSI